MNISVFDTTISDSNLGNAIIMDAVYKNLNEIFPNDFVFKIPANELTEHTLNFIKQSELQVFGGTNVLCPEMEKYSQWGINTKNVNSIHNFLSMGLGWWQHSDVTSKYTVSVLQKLFSNNFLHSVRDEYTKQKLIDIGINNVINTGCPTLWNLNTSNIKTTKSDSVLITLTDYNMNREKDTELINILKSNYKEIYYWIQGSEDYKYIKSLDFSVPEKNIIPPRLDVYNAFLENMDIDFIGTRLHGGIRALQKGKRTYIISVDNRATEMGKDFNLPVIERADVKNLAEKVHQKYYLDIKIPHENIKIWKEQFEKINFSALLLDINMSKKNNLILRKIKKNLYPIKPLYIIAKKIKKILTR